MAIMAREVMASKSLVTLLLKGKAGNVLVVRANHVEIGLSSLILIYAVV